LWVEGIGQWLLHQHDLLLSLSVFVSLLLFLRRVHDSTFGTHASLL
jgi:hypothetical protein